ncbi:ferritin [Paraliobacillus sp. JSM ZJ581]|uniref:ferritin n=1 Tax=Paraliobacillus sp. JSM ZJ581 TaxID=3342118 RepID=UPI0035A8B730
MVKNEVQQLINQLIQIEQISTTLYLAMSAYMEQKNYTGMAKWLKIQSDEERTHMLVLIDYLSGKDGVVKLGEIPAQSSNYGTPLETFEKVLAHEQYVTDAYRQAYDYVKQIDPQTTVIIQDFLREQIDEEAQALTIVNRLKLAENNTSAILLIDQELGQRQTKV